MNGEAIERILSYARDYTLRFNELTSTLANLGPPISLLPAPIFATLGFPVSDGAILFYLGADAAALIPEVQGTPGVYVSDADSRPLAHRLPALTFNHIKVFTPPPEALRSDLSNLPRAELLPDLPLDQVTPLFLSLEMKGAISQGHRALTAMAVSPIRQYHKGKVIGEFPTRVHVFSPIVRVGSGQLVRQYLWSFADVLWYPEQLDLSPERARLLAELDVDALRIGLESGLPQPQLFADPFDAVASHFEEIASTFERLLDSPDVDEPKVQEFLEVQAHRFLVSPIHKEVLPRRRLGHYIPDFVVLKSDSDYHFVEIEISRREIFQKKGEEPASILIHAETQVLDWLRYVDDNRDTVRREDGLSTIYAPTGEIVAGRDGHLSETARKRFEFMRAKGSRVRMRTYDDVLRDARAYAATLRRMRGAG